MVRFVSAVRRKTLAFRSFHNHKEGDRVKSLHVLPRNTDPGIRPPIDQCSVRFRRELLQVAPQQSIVPDFASKDAAEGDVVSSLILLVTQRTAEAKRSSTARRVSAIAMAHPGSIQNQATSEDASAAATAWLPRDVLAGVLLRLSDLRRFHRVCKEWRELISDPAFIDDYMDHGSQALTHTIVFFPGSAYRAKFPDRMLDFWTIQPDNGAGYLLNAHWGVTTRFTVGESEEMVGACNSLLCFLDVLQNDINIVEPFSGEAITLPLPPETEWHNHSAYCFGFDASSRRYKLLHLSTVSGQGLYMYTIGEDTNWRSVNVAPSESYYACPKIVEGAVFWSARGKDQLTKLMQFDLVTEEVTSELIDISRTSYLDPVCQVAGGSDARVRVIAFGKLGEQKALFIGEGAHWANSSTVKLPDKLLGLAWPQPLQRGHLLLWDYGNYGLYAHPIAPASHDLALGNLLLKMASSWSANRKPVTPRCKFVPVPAAEGRGVPYKESNANAFCYSPPVSHAPLARYFGKLPGLHKIVKPEIGGLLAPVSI